MNQCSCKIILRKELISKKTGLAPVAIQAFINGKRVVIALNQYVDPLLWDVNRGMVIGRGVKVADINLIISKASARATDIFTEYRLLNAMLTAEKFRELFLEESSRKDFIKFFDYELEQRRANHLIENGTYKSHNNTLQKLKAFSKGEPIYFSDISEKLLQQFDIWHYQRLKVKTAKLGREQVNNSLNTRHIALKNIKTYLNIAAKDEAIRFKNPFENGMPVRGVKGSREFLTPDELRSLIELYLKEELLPVQKGVLARFLCSCFTSLRISDHMQFDFDLIEGDSLVFMPKKTWRLQKTVRIPLNDISRYFIKEITERDFERISDQKTNLHLKGIATRAGIKKNVTSHVGRHTFATTFLMMGGQVHVLQQIMGHADIKTTMVYVHLIDDHLINQMQVMNSVAADLLPSDTK